MNTVDLVGRVASETGRRAQGGWSGRGRVGAVGSWSGVLGPEGHERTDLIPIYPGPAVPGAPVRLEAMPPHEPVEGVPADAEVPCDVPEGRCVHRNRSLPRLSVADRR
jgi:hypothetical protein